MKVDPEILEALLDRWPIGRLATVTPEGKPHVLPVVFIADAGLVCSPLDVKRKKPSALARVANVEAHGRASLLLDEYGADWSRLWWVRLDGPAWVERRNAAMLDRVGERLREKYPQYRRLAPYAGERTLLVLRPERVTAWTQRGDLQPIREAARKLG